MDRTLTVVQVLLGFAFTLGGISKIVLPYDRYTSIAVVAWSKEFKPSQLYLLGIIEIAGGLGLLVPLFLPSLTRLTPLAAVGIALYMAGAMATHLRRSEYPYMLGNLIVFLMPALFVAYGRLIGFAV